MTTDNKEYYDSFVRKIRAKMNYYGYGMRWWWGQNFLLYRKSDGKCVGSISPLGFEYVALWYRKPIGVREHIFSYKNLNKQVKIMERKRIDKIKTKEPKLVW